MTPAIFSAVLSQGISLMILSCSCKEVRTLEQEGPPEEQSGRLLHVAQPYWLRANTT